MNKIGVTICSVMLALCAVMFSACGEKSAKEIASVSATNLKQFYHYTETIDFDAIKLTVKYDDNSTKTLTKGEFDISLSEAKEDTEFIINTSGLYAQTGGELTEATYAFSCVIVGYDETFPLGSVSVSDNMNLIYDLVSFAEPQFVSQYKENIANTSDTEEGAFYKASQVYYVGDDNEFKFLPKLTLVSKTSNTNGYVVMNDYNATVKVEVKNGDVYTPVEDDTYFTYNNFAFQFTQSAIGKTFRISMLPTDFTTDFAGNKVGVVTFEVTVADGYNVYEAIDLGRMSLVTDNFASVAET